jgi:hypothetical protein
VIYQRLAIKFEASTAAARTRPSIILLGLDEEKILMFDPERLSSGAAVSTDNKKGAASYLETAPFFTEPSL